MSGESPEMARAAKRKLRATGPSVRDQRKANVMRSLFESGAVVPTEGGTENGFYSRLMASGEARLKAERKAKRSAARASRKRNR